MEKTKQIIVRHSAIRILCTCRRRKNEGRPLRTDRTKVSVQSTRSVREPTPSFYVHVMQPPIIWGQRRPEFVITCSVFILDSLHVNVNLFAFAFVKLRFTWLCVFVRTVARTNGDKLNFRSERPLYVFICFVSLSESWGNVSTEKKGALRH